MGHPTANIVRIGSLGTNDEWFCGDGRPVPARHYPRQHYPVGGLVFTPKLLRTLSLAGRRPSHAGHTPIQTGLYSARLPLPLPVLHGLDTLVRLRLEIGEAEIATEMMASTPHDGCQLATQNRRRAAIYKKMSASVQGPASWYSSLPTLRLISNTKRVLEANRLNTTDAHGEVDDPENQGG
jgi:hypothetical protein